MSRSQTHTTQPPVTNPATSGSTAPRLGDNLLHRAAKLKTRLLVSLLLSLPVMAISMTSALQFRGWQWVSAALATIVVTWGAWPFHLAAFRAARHATSTMDTLVSIGVSAAYLWSLWALLFAGAGNLDYHMEMSLLPRAHGSAQPHLYFEAATMITTFLLAGRYAEARARYHAGDALRSLLELGAKTAHRVRSDGSEEEVPTTDLAVGDLVVVRPGEKIPADGIVENGNAALDTSLITGESVPVPVSPGSEVTGATINTDGALQVRLTRVGADTTLSQIGQLVTQAQAGKAPVQRLADRVASIFVPIVLTIAALTLAGWLIAGSGVQAAFTAAVAVLVIACPCALGLATPTALLVGSGRAAQLGIVIKGPEILETTRVVDTAVFDKTGTLTQGKMQVKSVLTPPHQDADEVLRLAAAVEANSSHPVARAIASAYPNPLPSSSGFSNQAGRGVSAVVDNQLLYVGSPSWITQQGADLSALKDGIEDGYAAGATVTVVARAALAAAHDESSRGHQPGDSQTAPGSQAPADPANANQTGVHEDGAEQVSENQTKADTDLPLPTSEVRIIDLGISGMTCAACVRRVENKLGKLPGVEANVNLATDSARVTVRSNVTNEELLAAVEKSGYGATVRGETSQTPAPHAPSPHETSAPSNDSEAAHPRPAHAPTALGSIWVADEIKPDADTALEQLRALGITPVLLTGDNHAAAQTIAKQLGIEQVHAQVLPADKQTIIARLQAEGHSVAMVGDGVNDAAALAQAGQRGLGMAMGSGTDVAIEAADITLMGKTVSAVPTAIKLSRRTLTIIKENLFWAFAYNVAAIPLAVAGLLNPMIAGATMALSSIIVVSNSLRLRNWQPK